MRKIAIIGGTGIYSPETLQCFEEKVIQTPYGAALCNIGTMCGNQVIFITRHGVGHKTAPYKVKPPNSVIHCGHPHSILSASLAAIKAPISCSIFLILLSIASTTSL